ncbi:hypothetical protein [Actinotalea sp. C106]|uniref:hypothetical protein n=1 Tax=Actinotalea sp. C106 TaxID=2908644 RepID=UPI00202922C1|nr:hypothetical protein [Actinotalea sp. C106]
MTPPTTAPSPAAGPPLAPSTAESLALAAVWCTLPLAYLIPFLTQAGYAVMIMLLAFPVTGGYLLAGALLLHRELRRRSRIRLLHGRIGRRGLSWTWAWVLTTVGASVALTLESLATEDRLEPAPVQLFGPLVVLSVVALIGALMHFSRRATSGRPEPLSLAEAADQDSRPRD